MSKYKRTWVAGKLTPSALVPLTIEENGGQDHMMAAKLRSYDAGKIVSFYLGFDDHGNMTIRKTPDDGPEQMITMPPIDIDSMILFLQETKVFISESEMYRKLRG